MKCPECESENHGVKDSRPNEDETIRRRRCCFDCGYRFTTFERVSPFSKPLQFTDVAEDYEQLDKDDRHFVRKIVQTLLRARVLKLVA